MTSAQLLGLAVQASIMLTVLALGLSATWDDATHLFRRPGMLLRAVVSMGIVMPAVAAGIATAVELPFEVKVALVAIALSPVPPTLQKKQLGAGGSEGYVVGLLVAISVIAVVLVPLTLLILDRVFVRAAHISPEAVARILLTSVFAPLVVGMLLRRIMPTVAKFAGALRAVAGIVLVIGAAFILYGLWPVTRSFLGSGVALMLALMAAIGLGVGHVLGGPEAGNRTSLAIATASRHPAVAMAVATSGANPEPKPELAIILLYLIVATIITVPYQKWRAARGE